MGSKMSSSRGSSDQNTISSFELTSLPCDPLRSFHAPTDCKQTHEERICKEEDSSHDLPSKWKKDQGVKDTEVTLPSSSSHSSLGCPKTDNPVHSETIDSGKVDWKHRRNTASQARMEEKSGDTPENHLTSPTDTQGDSVEVHRKHGHPVKRRTTEIEAEKDEHPSGRDADGQNEQSDTIPCTVSMIPLQADIVNHNNGEIFEPDHVEGPIIHNPPQNEISGPRAVANGEPADSTPVDLKKKRGRPRKERITAFNDNLVNSGETDVSDADKDSGPARRLRSRREQHSTTSDGNITAPMVLDAKNTGEANQRGFKRRRKLPDQHILPKVSRLGVSRNVSSVVSSDTGAGERVEADMMGKLNTIKQEIDVNREGQLISRSGEGQRTTVRQVALGQRRLLPKVIPLQCQPSLSPRASGEPEAEQLLNSNASDESQSLIGVVSSKTRDPSKSSVRSSERDGKPSRTVDILSNVKNEDIEIELDNFNSMSESNSLMSLQYHANTAVKSECTNWNYDDTESQISLTNPIDKRQRNVKKCNEQGEPKPRRRRSLFGYRRSKQEKRRRPLLQGDPVSVPKKQDSERKNKAPKRRDCGDSDNQECNSNGSSTKGREKALLKCKDCGRSFKFLSQYIIHRRIHTGERPYKCNECGKAFSKNSNLNLHLKTHKNDNLASSEYPSHMKMHSHMPKQDSEEGRSNKLRRRVDRNSNQVSHTPVSVRRNGKPTCQYCGKQFPFQSALVRHVRVHTGEKPYKCDICGRGFGQAYFLRVHELTHWSVKRYNCTLCGKSFTHYSNAKNHPCRFLKDNQDKQPKRRFKPSLSYTCHICKNTYYQLQDFNSHMKDHTGAKLYRCLFCDKLFGVLSEFNVHRNQCSRARGEGDAPTNEVRRGTFEFSLPRNRRNSSGQISAPVLSAVSSEIQKVTSHESLESSQTRHKKPSKKPFQSTVMSPRHLPHLVSKLNKLDNRSDPRKYLCPSCGRLFRHMGRLRAHMLTHARGQSYTCGCCGKTLENWKKLWHHQRIHRQRRGRFTCPQCGRGFRFVGPYKRHMTEHPEYQWIQGRPNKVSLPYQCEECSASFKTLDLLFSHQLCHSSSQDINKDSDYHLSLDDHSAHSNRNMFNPHMNSCTTDLCPESHTYYYPAPLQMDPPPEGPVPSLPPQIPVVPLAQNQSLETWETIQQPSSTLWQPEGESTPSHDKIEENAFGMRARTLKSPKKQVTSGGIKLKECEESSEGLKCAVCGSAHPTISDLYQHYLQHARGQL